LGRIVLNCSISLHTVYIGSSYDWSEIAEPIMLDIQINTL
jgi:hypothetical protein